MNASLLDTSFIVRYLTNDPPESAAIAERVIDGEEPLAVTAVALVETAYVLTKGYGLSRQQVVDALVDLLGKENIAVLGPHRPLVVEALLLCRPSARVSFADAMIWADARGAQVARVYSFDRRFPSQGIELDRGGQQT